MSYRFSPHDRDIDSAVRRIAREQIECALAGFEKPDSPLPIRIHNARKSVKKLRGLIRLIRPGFDDFAKENDALRAAGQTIATLRNADVMLSAFDALVGGIDLDANDLSSLREPFQHRKAAAETPEALAKSVAAFAKAMAKVRSRAAGWTVQGDGFAALRPGLERSFHAAQKAMQLVRKSPHSAPDKPVIHAWRKRVKDHWYQCRLLVPLWPEMTAPRIIVADDLGALLGDHHDLSELIGLLPQGDISAPLIAQAQERQATLLAQALPLSRRLLAGTPHALGDQWQTWWKVWRQ